MVAQLLVLDAITVRISTTIKYIQTAREPKHGAAAQLKQALAVIAWPPCRADHRPTLRLLPRFRLPMSALYDVRSDPVPGPM